MPAPSPTAAAADRQLADYGRQLHQLSVRYQEQLDAEAEAKATLRECRASRQRAWAALQAAIQAQARPLPLFDSIDGVDGLAGQPEQPGPLADEPPAVALAFRALHGAGIDTLGDLADWFDDPYGRPYPNFALSARAVKVLRDGMEAMLADERLAAGCDGGGEGAGGGVAAD